MIGVLGINHKTADIKIREAFYIANNEIIPLSELIIQKTDITEIVIISTCNRTEIYFYCESPCYGKSIDEITETVKDFKGVKTPYKDAFYLYTSTKAIHHLFEVISGVDSLVIGENQIVSQVKDFYLKSTKAALTGAMLMRLFQKSFETSKRVRTETNIQQGATSISYVAVDWCHKKLGDLSNKNILLIGTGETGKIALSHLADKGANKFLLANRTYEPAEKYAKLYEGNAIHLKDFKSYLPECDIVITATNSKDHLITKADVEKYINGKPNLFVDLSVPRNIDGHINELANAEVVAVDDFKNAIDTTNKIRTESIEKAHQIIDEMVAEYTEWFAHRRLRPVITTITKHLDEIHRDEIENSKGFHDKKDVELMEAYGERLKQKYTRHFVKNLKLLSNNDLDDKTILIIKSLFSQSE